MRKITYIPLANAPERFMDYSCYKDLFGYDDSYNFYGAFHKGQQVGYGAVKDGEVIHVSSVDPEVDQGLYRLMHLHGYRDSGDSENSGILAKSKGKEPKDMILAPIPFIYDVHKKHIQIGYEGEKTRDIKPYRGEFTPGGIVEGEYQPSGKMIIYPSNTALYTTSQITNTWTRQFGQMEITSVEIEHEGKTHKVATIEDEWTKTSENYNKDSNIWDFPQQTSSTEFKPQEDTINTGLIVPTSLLSHYKTHMKQSMAADPNWLNSWIAQNGPYAYHSFSNLKIAKGISKNGLLPWDHPQNPTTSEYAGGPYQPRKNHVYLELPSIAADPYTGQLSKQLMYRNPYVAKIDLTKLDPNNINADEDSSITLPAPAGLGNKGTLRDTPFNSYGEYADSRPEISNFPLNVQRSFERNNTISHHGVIPPEALEIMNYKDAFPVNQRQSSMDPGQFVRVLNAANPASSIASEALKFAGGKVYVVGGAVRDALRGENPKDIDLMVAGLPSDEVDNILSKLPGHVNLTGKKFGVYRYHHDGHEVEIALPRQDKYETSRRGEGVITVDHNLPVEKDLERRDFTVNSMAVDLDTGDIVDPYNGRNDLDKHLLRTTHPDSFREDPTRLVRALTAHSRFGLNPDERTRDEMASNAHLLRGESPDALNKILDKLFSSHNPASAIRLAHETGVLKHLFPEVDDNWDFDQRSKYHNHTLGEHSMQVLGRVSDLSSDPDLRMAAMMHDVGKPASSWEDPETHNLHFYEKHMPDGTVLGADHATVGAKMAENRLRALNYPVNRIKRVTHLINHHMFNPGTSDKWGRKFINQVGDEHADDLLHLREADQGGKGMIGHSFDVSADQMREVVDRVRKGQQPTDLNNLAINGNDLISMGFPQGPAIGQTLRALLDHTLDVPTDNNHAKLLELAKGYMR